MKIIILAGGRGARLLNSTATVPKALITVGEKTILQHQIDLLEQHGFTDIRLSLGYLADQIIDYLDDKYEYVVEQEKLGTGGAIKFASRDLAEPFMVLNGDIISDVNVADFVATHQSDANCLIVSHHKQNTNFGLLKLDEQGRIVKFREKPAKPTDGHVSVGFYILQPDVFRNISQKAFSIEYDVFPALARAKKLHSYLHQGYWYDLGTEERLAYVRSLFEK